MSIFYPLEERVARVYQRLWTHAALRRHGSEFDRVERYCFFAGYSRSGHTLVGALLNAHPDAVIAHELGAQELIVSGCTREALYAQLLARAWWFHLRGDISNYRYRVPGQWQGRFARLRVIGDKRGGGVTRCLAEHPDLFDRVRSLVAVPIRVIHVARNPFDNIAAISTWNRLSLEDSVEYYFRHSETTSKLASLCGDDELETIRHEEMVRDPRAVLIRLLGFLGLEQEERYLKDCSSIVFAEPTYPRRKVAWPAAMVRNVERHAREHPFLHPYSFEDFS